MTEALAQTVLQMGILITSSYAVWYPTEHDWV